MLPTRPEETAGNGATPGRAVSRADAEMRLQQAVRSVAAAPAEHGAVAVAAALDMLADTLMLSSAHVVREDHAERHLWTVAASGENGLSLDHVPAMPHLWAQARSRGALVLDARAALPREAASERNALEAAELLPAMLVPIDATTPSCTGLLLVHPDPAVPVIELASPVASLAQVLLLALRHTALHRELTENNSRFRDYTETISDWFWETDTDHVLTFLGAPGGRDRVVDPNNYIGLHPWDIPGNIEGPDEPPWPDHRDLVRAREPFRELRFRRRRSDGAVRHFSTSGKPVHDPDGTFRGYRGLGMDVTEREQALRALSEKTRQLEVTLECMHQGIAVHDSDLNLIAHNRMLQELLDLPDHILAPGTPIEDIVRFTARRGEYGPGDVEELVRARMERIVDNPPTQYYRTTSAGRILDVHNTILPDGMMVLTYTDITTQQSLHEQIDFTATHDLLTGLINRTEFEVQLAHLVEDAKGGERQHALLYLDLDQFKVVNDTCGHAAGDELLRQLGEEFERELRQSDTVSRLGGDEFGILIHHCSLDIALAVAEKLRTVVERFRFSWEAQAFKLSASMGLVLIESDGMDASRLLSRADAACFIAKDTGRNRIHVYAEDDHESGQRHSQMHWVSRIHGALEEDRLTLFQQQIVPLQEAVHEDLHFEVLVRMRDEFGALVPPGAFLEAAERYSLAGRLDYWVVDRCLDWLAANPSLGERIALCSINLSGASLGDERLLGRLLERISEPGLDASRLCFEITETAVISRLAAARHFIEKLRDEGCMFALDDFGTGLSSFGYLRNLPIDIVKIDGTFVRDMLSNRLDRAMVESINDIAQQMGKLTVAEFVEDAGTVRLLANLGIDYAQGYHFGTPAPLTDLA